jgi:hypothetical protein
MRSFGCYEGYTDLIRYVANYHRTGQRPFPRPAARGD